MIRRVLLAIACSVIFLPLFAETVVFHRDVLPILSGKCFKCHGPDEAQRQAGLRLDRASGILAKSKGGTPNVVPGDPASSELIRRIRHHDRTERMPPAKERRQLSSAEIETLVRWIEEGASWQRHWAFVAPVRPDLPKLSDQFWERNEIDRFVWAGMQRNGLSPAPEASKATLIRRASLDLTGLPPSPEEVAAFDADERPDAWERLLDRLMESPRHGEQMAWHWLEASRYADTDGYQNDGPRDMWRWRDWVIDAYNRNLPFDRFTVEQLAGDLLPSPSLSQMIATGFNRNHRYNSESGLVFEEFLLENAVDRVDTTATVWMGMTAGCARCHDHKFDPISQKEYYQLVAYFDDVPETGRAVKFGNSEPWITAPTERQQERLAALTRKVDERREALRRAAFEIDREERRWERSADPERLGAAVVPAGLAHHYPGPYETDGTKGEELEKIANLICNGRFSIAFRIRPQQTDRGAVLSNELPATGRNGVLVQFHEGHLRFHIITRWIAGVATLETIETFAPGQSLHFVLTNDGSQRAKGMNVYLNGKLAPTRVLHNSNSNKSPQQFGGIMRIGISHHLPGWAGEMRDLRFYPGRTLSPSEAAVLAEPSPIEAILNRDSSERTERQTAKLRDYYLNYAASETFASLARELRQAQEERQKYYDSLPTTMVMEESPIATPTYVRLRGVYHQKGKRVERGVPEVLPALPDGYPNNRLGLARWLVSGEHPLTARVIVNRYWQQLFGRGLVATPEDFGTQGSLPTHPQLLDWLAVEFVANGWNNRSMLKLIMSSATYRQSSMRSRESIAVDPDNIWLSHMPRRRLPGNVLRDQALLLGNLLVEQNGGPSVKPYQPQGLWREASNFSYQIGKGQDLYRRSLYTYWKRTLAPPSLAVLDVADREWCSVRPRRTNTPLQALTLLNEQAFFESAVGVGHRMARRSGGIESKIRWAFSLVTAREPNPNELEVLIGSLKSYRQLFSDSPEAAKQMFRRWGTGDIPEDQVEWASCVALANVLLNLDETIMKE